MLFRDWIEKTEGNKVIITDRVKNGNKLLRRLNREHGVDVKGVKCISLLQIATEFLCAYYAIYEPETTAADLLPQEAGGYVMDEILREKNGDKLLFVPEECFCVKTAEAILQSINQVRMNNKKKAYDTATDCSVVQIKSLIYWYEQKLKSMNRVDEPLLLKTAIEKFDSLQYREPSGNGPFICLPWLANSNLGILADYECTALEQRFMDCLSSMPASTEKREIVSLEFYPVPQNTDEQNGQSPVDYTFFKAYGMVNEISYVIRRMLNDGLKFGDVNLIYSEDRYAEFIASAFESQGIPYAFLTGKRASETKVVQFFLRILEWASDDYLYEKLAFVVENQLMTFRNIQDAENAEANQLPMICYNQYLRKGIGWGKERYAACVKRVENSGEAKKYQYFNRFLCELVDVFSKPTDCGETYRKLLELGKNYLFKSKEKNEILKVLKEEIPVLQQAKVSSEEEGLRLLHEHLNGLRIMESENRAAVSVMKVGNLEVLDRPYQFIIGLSAKQFAVDAKESPLLSDEELEKYIDGKVELSKDAGIKRSENLKCSLATLEKGSVYMGYSTYDTIELKESSPAVLYSEYYEKYGNGIQDSCEYVIEKQAICLSNGNMEAEAVDYMKQLKEETEKKREAKRKMSAQEQQSVIKEDTNEWESEEDEYGFEDDEYEYGFEDDEYGIEDGDEYWYGFEDDDEYDDEFEDDYAAEDGIYIEEKMSPSGLQTLLTCPLRYYYAYREYLPKREFLEKSDSAWLNPVSKGNLFHWTMETYCNEVIKQMPITQPEPDEDKFNDIYHRMVEKMLSELPYVSESIFEQEREEARAVTWSFLCNLTKSLYQDAVAGTTKKEWRVLGCELAFDKVDYDISDEVVPEATVVIHFNGSIDRLDGYVNADGDLCLRVTDYKTGKREKLEKNVKNEEQIQHFVYAMAAVEYFKNHKAELEALFGKQIKKAVIESVKYVFPYEEEKKQEVDVTAKVMEQKHAEVYHLPETVRERARECLYTCCFEYPKPELQGIIKQRLVDKKAEKKICQYCNYLEQCRLKLGEKL